MTESYEINLRNVRISYPHIFEPYSYQGEGKPSYSATFLLHKEQHAALIKDIVARMKALAGESFKDKKLPPSDKLCLRDGDQSGRPESEGHWTMAARESTRPLVVHRDMSPLVESDEVIYAGCIVNARIRLWAQDNKYGRRINANLLGVQFVGDGERLGGRGRLAPESMFEPVSSFDDAPGDDPFA
jgi:hypothetical protein